jgi:phage tail sheath protein FI
LNPASDNYVAKRIGDKYEKWDYDSRRYKEYGDYANNSDYIRVEMASDVSDAVTNPLLLPFGVFGPPQYKGYQVSPSGTLLTYNGDDPGTAGTFVYEGLAYAGARPADPVSQVLFTGSSHTVRPTKVTFPELRLRVSSSEGFVIDPTDAYFGVDTTFNSNEFDKTTLDVIRAKPDTLDSHVADDTTTENSWVFSLDNIRNVNVSESYAGGGADVSGAYAVNAVYDATARTNRTAYTNHTSSAGLTNVPINAATASYENVLDAGFDRFTTCLHGGFDALDIMEREPFRNTLLDDGGTETTNYAYNSINVAIDSLRDPERTEFNLVAMPGITNNSLNSKLVRTAESRGDALAIIDPQGGFVPDTEGTQSIEDRLGSVESTVDNMQQNLKLNSSYGAAYYPWVQIRDNVNGATLWAPPSVAAIGALAYSEAVSELWFAPAGFTRGGLSANNAAGIPVIGVRQRLTSKDRDKLYENNINPIATFPAEGIVIFGQKTLQATPSALDRINVRRLTIFLKREISRIAATLLFDQNVQVTWNKFRGQAETFLSGVKAGLGLTDYKVILDETTTTPDLVDRNILYAKIYVKPARAIEFIAIDFIITDSGAAFDD